MSKPEVLSLGLGKAAGSTHREVTVTELRQGTDSKSGLTPPHAPPCWPGPLAVAGQPRADSSMFPMISPHSNLVLPTSAAWVLTVQPLCLLHPGTSQACHAFPDHRPFTQTVLSAWITLAILPSIQYTLTCSEFTYC